MPRANTPDPSIVRRCLCATLSGVLPEAASDPAVFDALLTMARAERVDALLAYVMRREGSTAGSSTVRAILDQRWRHHLVLGSMRERELLSLADAFAASGVDMLLLKGAALAYTVYAVPHLRPRDDIDVFVRHDDLDPTERALTAAGFARLEEPDLEIATTQRHYAKFDEAGLRHLVDVHWRVAVPRVFADVLSFEEAWSRSVAIPAIGPAARTLGIPDSLFLACVHRVAHHDDALNLLWLLDIHLLASRMTETESAEFAALAARARMCAVCLRGLSLAQEYFGTNVDDLSAGVRAAQAANDEPSTVFLGGLRKVDILRSDLGALPGWSERFRLIREHLFPPAAHMRALSGADAFLPAAYLRRIVRGAPAWFRRPGNTGTH